jgi:hypothetical protein
MATSNHKHYYIEVGLTHTNSNKSRPQQSNMDGKTHRAQLAAREVTFPALKGGVSRLYLDDHPEYSIHLVLGYE